SAQMLLIGARLLGHAATEAEPGYGRTSSLVAMVKKGNDPSKTNIEAALFRPLEQRPSWFRYDELSWHGSIVADEWLYYYASHETVLRAAKLMGQDLLRGRILLTRTNRTTGADEEFLIHSQLHDIVLAAGDIERLLEGTFEVKLCPPPEQLVF